MNPSIQQLAQLMQARQEQGETPYVLLLGSSLSLTPAVRRAFAETEDWEAFWEKMQRTSPSERKALLKKALDALGLEPGYQAIAQLAVAGYFDLIFTLNVDDAIDDAMRPLPADQCVLPIYDGSNTTQIVETLSRAMPRLKVVKLRGDINAQALPLTVTGQFEFPGELEQCISEWLKRDTILVGDVPYDDDVQRCIRRSNDALWCILPDEPASDSFTTRVKKVRQAGEIITGTEFNTFFTTLTGLLQVSVTKSTVQQSTPFKLHPICEKPSAGTEIAILEKGPEWSPARMIKVFLSVSHRDIDFAEQLCSSLWEQGIEVWLYTRQRPENLFTRQIDNELNSADFFCAVCSEAYFDSKLCREELAMARVLLQNSSNTKLKAVIPILVGSCELPPSLQAGVWVDSRTQDYDYVLDQLANKFSRDLIAKPSAIKKSEVSLDEAISEILEFCPVERIVDFEEEIALFREMLASDEAPPILLIKSPSGRGKTWLLHRYLHICHNAGLRTSYIDFEGGAFPDTQTIIDTIVRQINVGWEGMSAQELRGALRALAIMEESRNVVLLFDTIEKAPKIGQWLVDNLLVPIKDERLYNLRLVLAGQEGLQSVQTEEWLGIIEYRFTLPLWKVEDIQRFGGANGLNIDQGTASLIYRGTKGFPQFCAFFVKNLLRS